MDDEYTEVRLTTAKQRQALYKFGITCRELVKVMTFDEASQLIALLIKLKERKE